MIKTLGAAIVSFAFITFPFAVSAQSVLDTKIVPENCQGARAAWDCGVCDLATMAQNVLNMGIFVAVFLSAILFAWAGWKYLTAGGGEGITQARSIFTNVLVGLIIILAGWLIVDTLIKTLTGDKLGPWNQVCQNG